MPQTELGVSYKETVDTLVQFLEIVIHTILCIRGVYPATTFTRRRAYDVPVYQNRHPQVRKHVATLVAEVGKQIEKGAGRRVTVAIKSVATGLPLERFIIDFGYLPMGDNDRNAKIPNAPTPEELRLKLRGFLIRLTALDSQLEDLPSEEVTFAVIIENETDDEFDPSPDWVPASAADTLTPTPLSPGDLEGHHEPLLSVRAVETGVIDLRMTVQECVAKTGVQHLDV